MKKILSVFLTVMMIIVLAACSSTKSEPRLLTEEGIAPYILSESDEYLLQSFGMVNDSQIISFNAPKEAITLLVNVYSLNEDGNWKKISDSGGGISIGTEREPIEKLKGTFTVLLKDNYAINFNINAGGIISSTTEEIDINFEKTMSVKAILTDFQEIEINKEIPVTIMVYDSGRSMRSYIVKDYFDPSKFEGMDLVQAVTLTFTDQEL